MITATSKINKRTLLHLKYRRKASGKETTSIFLVRTHENNFNAKGTQVAANSIPIVSAR